jgi:exosortase
MTSVELQPELSRGLNWREIDRATAERFVMGHQPAIAIAIAFALLFWQPFTSLAKDWWNSPEAGHGLLLAPVSIWLAVKAGIRADATPNRVLGLVVLFLAVVIRCAAGLAAELFTMRASIVMALVGLTIYFYGIRQVLHWWLPFALGSLAIPLPELVTQAMALPLQFKASQLGASLLEMREIPVRLTGNVIRIPGNELFVTEACSGLRSLTALLSLSILMGALTLRMPILRALLVLLAIPIAIVVNGVRVFLTGFLVYFVDPALGKGFMHTTEGWLLFIVSMTALGGFVWLAVKLENRLSRRTLTDADAVIANA